MRREISFLLAAMLAIFLLGFLSGMAVERSIALSRSNRQALCREACQRRQSIRVTSLADLEKPELRAEIRQAEEDIEAYCEAGPTTVDARPQSGHSLVAGISLVRSVAAGAHETSSPASMRRTLHLDSEVSSTRPRQRGATRAKLGNLSHMPERWNEAVAEATIGGISVQMPPAEYGVLRVLQQR